MPHCFIARIKNISIAGGAYNRNISLISRGLIRPDARRLGAGLAWRGEPRHLLAIPFRASRGDARIYSVIVNFTKLHVPCECDRVTIAVVWPLVIPVLQKPPRFG